MAKEKQSKWKPGMECVPGNTKEEGGKAYLCNKKGRWQLFKKKRTIEAGIKRLFPEHSK